ncbi:ATPase, T2SS/T4P/T4SS family [Desulfotomaculum nigrificans]|uniref:ATPase, T2SS/T4P/T4SS family n=1 Tax=Desulfotomaculum nigrificans TaxID=1565 RepID=UPI0001FAE591|nr:ATPase, T2SS/T4P/T4SS family [Desulfotomaculum nigrificans]
MTQDETSPIEISTLDWEKDQEATVNDLVETLAAEISRSNPGLFDGGQLFGGWTPEVEEIVRKAILTKSDLIPPGEQDEIIRSIKGQVTGYGKLAQFFEGEGAEEITEIMVNPSKDGPKVFYAKHSRPYYAGPIFKDNEDALRYFQKICNDSKRPFTSDNPIVDAWMRDGSRLAVMGFDCSPLGVAGTIRKSPLVRPPIPLKVMVENGTLPQLAADILGDILVDGHANLAVCGRTDSGKTTFMRAMAERIDPMERMIIGETSFELYLAHMQNCINLVEVSVAGKQVVSMGDICKSINRNNPERAILSEIRGGEIVAGSEIAESTSGGFWTTLHAGSVAQFRSRIPKLFMWGGMVLPREYIDEQIASMFHFLIFCDKDPSGKRTFMELVEVNLDLEKPYKTIIRFDKDAFATSQGKIRRWIYENPISQTRLSELAFRGAKINRKEYETNEKGKYLYPGPGGELSAH